MAVHLYLDQREQETVTLPVWYTLYISDAHRLLGKCERKTIWWKEKKTNTYNSSLCSLSAILMQTERQRRSLHFQRVLVCSHTGWHWDGARWSVNSRVINKPTVHHRDVRGRRGRTPRWEEGGAPMRKLCLIRLIQRVQRDLPVSFIKSYTNYHSAKRRTRKRRAREQWRRLKVLGRLWLSVGRAHTALCIHDNSDLKRLSLRFVITFADCWRRHSYFLPYFTASSANYILNTVVSSTHNSLVRMKQNMSSDRQDSNKEEYILQCTQVQVVCCEFGSALLWLRAEQNSESIWQPGTHRWRGGGGCYRGLRDHHSWIWMSWSFFERVWLWTHSSSLSLFSISLQVAIILSSVPRSLESNLTLICRWTGQVSICAQVHKSFFFFFFFLSLWYNLSPTSRWILF